MCLITDKNPQIAEKDLTVYKMMYPMIEGYDYQSKYIEPGTRTDHWLIRVNEKLALETGTPILTDRVRAVYMRFIYEIGRLYKTDIERDNSYSLYGTEEEQNELNQAYGIDWRDNRHNNGLISIGPGFHSAVDPKYLGGLFEFTHFLCECTIPAGSEYYTGFGGLIVSNQIIINRIIERKNSQVTTGVLQDPGIDD